MARNKTPGTDGYPIEFYAAYEDTLAPKLCEIYTEALKIGCLPTSLEEALIIVLPKQERDPLEVSLYRPLSMLNMDYKILSKVLVSWLVPQDLHG